MVNVASGLAHLALPYGTAYCMSKRGLIAYSDALRLEHGDAITVTTVYPGYIRTPIHARVAGGRRVGSRAPCPPRTCRTPRARSPAPRSGRPARDLATTRNGAVGYALPRHVPRRLLDADPCAAGRLAAGGHFDGSTLFRRPAS